MPSRSRQWTCRFLFLALGVLPLASSIGWAAYRGVTLNEANYRAWLIAQTGLDMRIGNVINGQPDRTRLERVNLVDSETGKLIARCGSLHVQQSDRAIRVQLPDVEVQPNQFRRLLELLHDRVLRQPRLLQKPIYVVADSVLIPGQGKMLRLAEFRLDSQLTKVGPQAKLTFRWADEPDSELVRLYLVRDHTASAPRTTIDLQTGTSPLPCSLLGGLPNEELGDLTFQGNVHLQSAADGWVGEASGFLKNLRLEQWTAADAIPVATGSATVLIRRAEFRGSWMTLLEGQLTAQSGTINTDFLVAAARNLELQTDDSFRTLIGSGTVDFDAIGVDFQVNRRECVLRGIAGDPSSEAMVQWQDRAIISQSLEIQQPTAALARTFLGLSPHDVPISTAASTMMRLIPLR